MKVVPKGFRQLLILMVYLPAYEQSVPLFVCLMSSRCEASYIHALQACISATNWRLSPSTISADFEKAFMNALKRQFESCDAKVL